jgi:hypothetical protein
MADITEATAGPASVVVTEDAQCRYWCRRFGVRPKALKRAVRAVGTDPADVENYLGPGKTGPNDASHWRSMSGL